MEKITAKDIIRSVGLSSEIEAHLTNPQDLHGDTIYYIYVKIASCIGSDQAIAFVNMIRTIEPLSTVNFLHSLYQLEKADWNSDFRYSTAKKRREFLSHFGEEKGPREKERVVCNDDDHEL